MMFFKKLLKIKYFVLYDTRENEWLRQCVPGMTFFYTFNKKRVEFLETNNICILTTKFQKLSYILTRKVINFRKQLPNRTKR